MVTAIVITLMLACSCAAFVYGKQVGYIERNAQLADDQRKETEDAYAQLMADYKQIEYQLDVEQKEKQRQTPQTNNGWEAIDIRRT